MKKIFCTVLVLVFALCLLAACSKSPASNPEASFEAEFDYILLEGSNDDILVRVCQVYSGDASNISYSHSVFYLTPLTLRADPISSVTVGETTYSDFTKAGIGTLSFRADFQDASQEVLISVKDETLNITIEQADVFNIEKALSLVNLQSAKKIKARYLFDNGERYYYISIERLDKTVSAVLLSEGYELIAQT